MKHHTNGIYRVGGAALIASGMLFFVQALLVKAVGDPPANGEAILAWVDSGKIALSFISEVLFFATLLMIPGVVALYRSLVEVDQVKAVMGCGILASSIPVLMVLLIVHGRLIFPVYGISASTPDVALLVVAFFYGGLHAIGIVFGIATFILSLAMRRAGYGGSIVAFGFIAAASDIIGAYPYIIGPVLTLFCQTVSAAWFVAVGWKLIKLRETE